MLVLSMMDDTFALVCIRLVPGKQIIVLDQTLEGEFYLIRQSEGLRRKG